jgi:epoxide hydrolase-like predicted phosphatase
MTSSMGGAFAAFSLESGVDPSVFKRVIQEAYGGEEEGMIARVETGQITPEEFETWLAGVLSEGLDRPLDPRGLRDRLFAGLEEDHRMADAVARARGAGVRTGLISNSWGGAAYRRERFDELFDAVVISEEVGVRKPHPSIYRLAARRLGVEPDACVFVDDLLPNVEGARAVGMEGIVHRSAEFTIPKLEALLGVDLTDGRPPPGNPAGWPR